MSIPAQHGLSGSKDIHYCFCNCHIDSLACDFCLKEIVKALPKKDCVIAHQLLAAAKIIVEQLTELGYNDKHAAKEYKKLKKMGIDDQAAIRMIAAAVSEYARH